MPKGLEPMVYWIGAALTAQLALDLGDAAVRVLGDSGTTDDRPEGAHALINCDSPLT